MTHGWNSRGAAPLARRIEPSLAAFRDIVLTCRATRNIDISGAVDFKMQRRPVVGLRPTTSSVVSHHSHTLKMHLYFCGVGL